MDVYQPPAKQISRTAQATTQQLKVWPNQYAKTMVKSYI